MQESAFEQYIRKRIRKTGGRSFKWVCPGMAGVPDRIFIFPGGRIVFAEIKRPGRANGLSPRQKKIIAQLQELGATVWVVNDKTDFENRLQEFLKVGGAYEV